MAKRYTQVVDVCNQCPNFSDWTKGHGPATKKAPTCSVTGDVLGPLNYGQRRVEIPSNCPLPENDVLPGYPRQDEISF